MKYMEMNAVWLSTTDNSVLVECGGNLARIKTSTMMAKEDQPFCQIDCLSAGVVSGKAWLPVSEGEEGMGWRGKGLNGEPVFASAKNHRVYDSFQDALDVAYGDIPVATATVHLLSVALSGMNEEQFENLSRETKNTLLEAVFDSRLEENMREYAPNAYGPKVDEVIEQIVREDDGSRQRM